MKIKKNILLGLSLNLLASTLTASVVNLQSEEALKGYEMGHYHGINQLEREFLREGIEKKKVEFKKYMVVLNISQIPAHRIYLLKSYGDLEGLTPTTLTNNMLVFKSFNREPDAEYLKNLLNKNYHLDKTAQKAYIYINDKDDAFYTSPFIYQDMFSNMLKIVKEQVKGKVFIVKESDLKKEAEPKENLLIQPKAKESVKEEPVQEPEEKKPVKKHTPKYTKKYFNPKYAIKALMYMGDFISYNSKQWDDKEFVEIAIELDPTKTYTYANTITTKNGEEYVKIYNKNLWIGVEDVEFK
jgi:hypothetical protein